MAVPWEECPAAAGSSFHEIHHISGSLHRNMLQ